MSSVPPPDAANTGNADPTSYWVVSIEPVAAPEDCTGADWFVYRIAQGANEITGYRRGTRAAVRADVDTIVAGLNERRGQVKPSAKGRRAASQIRLGGAQ